MNDQNEYQVHIENERKYKIERFPKESLLIYCNNCRTHTSHKTIIKSTINVDCSNVPISFVEKYRIVECAGCHTVRFTEQTLCSADEEFYESEKLVEPHTHIYPISEDGALSGRDLNALPFCLPDGIKKIYNETFSAIKNKLFTISGIALRTLLDMICREKNIGKKDDNLFHRIEIMYGERHLITEDEKSILHTIRNWGNHSAHQGTRLNSSDLDLALIVIEHILEKLYLFPMLKKDIDNSKEEISFVDEVFPDSTEKTL